MECKAGFEVPIEELDEVYMVTDYFMVGGAYGDSNEAAM